MVASTQRAAQASLEWFENLGQYAGQDPHQFAFNIMTRSRRVTYDNLRLRDPEFVAAMDEWFAASQEDAREACPPMFQPFRIGRLELANRVIVSPMDMYSATDGVPGDFHLVHLGSKALGGAGLVMTEMVCVSPTGRITPGCTGIYTAEQEESWRRVAGFVHGRTSAKIGIQLGHSGRKGSTRLMWEGMDAPLPEGNWEVCGPSALPYTADSQTPRELTVAELAEIKDQFVAAARAAARAGFDLLELHCAHGYLLSSFLSPLTNRRTDRYGGSLAARLRYPLEVFDAIRAVWPEERPMTVRISATDWHPDGLDIDDTIEIARAFAEHGAAGHRRVDRAGRQRREARLRPQLPDAVRGPDQERDRHQVRRRGDRGRRDLLLRRRELDHPGGPGRSVRARPDPPVRPAVDPARRRRAGIHRPGRGLARSVRRGPPTAAGRAHRRPPTPARADPGRDAAHRARPLAPGRGRGHGGERRYRRERRQRQPEDAATAEPAR